MVTDETWQQIWSMEMRIRLFFTLKNLQQISHVYLLFLAGGSPVLAPKSNPSPKDTSSAPLNVNLLQFRKNVSDLRMQLHQMRQIQARHASPLHFTTFHSSVVWPH